MGYVQERYKAVTCPVNTATTFLGSGTGGFLAITAGTLTVATSMGVVLVNAVPVTAGAYTPIPIYVSHLGGIATTAGGASGVLMVD